MGSSRFPGKVLAALGSRTMLRALLNRLARIAYVDELIVATSDARDDDAIAIACASAGVNTFRGSEGDVLQRYADAAEAYRLDVIIRVCADSPLTDPEGIAKLMRIHAEGDTRFVSNRRPTGWPIGTAADLMTYDALQEAADEAEQADHREHVVPFLFANADRFSVRTLDAPPELYRPRYFLAVDHPEHLEALNVLSREFGEAELERASLQEMLAFIDTHSAVQAGLLNNEH
jgi:spore coat polysaccharide biosynthesis protein SpsF